MTRLASTTTWTYRRADSAGVVELASWQGRGALGLKPHFHDETQIVLVLTGSRAFRVDGTTVTVPAGHAASIPAGLLHTPIAMEQDTICLNAYVPPDRSPLSVQVCRIPWQWQHADEISAGSIQQIADHMLARERTRSRRRCNRTGFGATLSESGERIGEIAANLGWSREGFSRMAKRELGIAPHAFRVLSRLNLARQLLREGQSIAAVAADAGFSDQSHLTRLFRRTFGTTPGLYLRD